jgi:Spy/CpxP family protein refolding chaperone
MVRNFKASGLGCIWAIVLIVAALMAGPLDAARAQGSPTGLMVRVIPVHALEGFGDALGLDNDQRETLKELHRGYRSARVKAQQEAKAMQEEFQESMQNMDWSKPDEAQAKMKEQMKKLGELNLKATENLKKAEEALYTDVRAILTPEQDARWERGQRWMRRSDASRFGVMAGSMADVTELAKQVGIERTGDVGALLDRYEEEVDSAIVGWRGSISGLSDMITAAMEDPMGAQEKIGKVIEGLFTNSHKVREVNRRAVRQLKDLAGEEKGAKLETAFLARSYPLVYGERRADKIMGAFKEDGSGFAGLSQEQRNEVKILAESHQRDMGIIRRNLARGIDEEQEKILKDALKMMDGPDIQEDSLFKASIKSRDELEDKTLERLQAIVGEAAFGEAKKDTKEDPKGEDDELIGNFDWLEEEETEPE